MEERRFARPFTAGLGEGNTRPFGGIPSRLRLHPSWAETDAWQPSARRPFCRGQWTGQGGLPWFTLLSPSRSPLLSPSGSSQLPLLPSSQSSTNSRGFPRFNVLVSNSFEDSDRACRVPERSLKTGIELVLQRSGIRVTDEPGTIDADFLRRVNNAPESAQLAMWENRPHTAIVDFVGVQTDGSGLCAVGYYVQLLRPELFPSLDITPALAFTRGGVRTSRSARDS